MKIVEAQYDDLVRINDLHNFLIEQKKFTASFLPWSIERRKNWYDKIRSNGLKVFLFELHNSMVGFFYFSPWREGREGLRNCVEISFYIDPKFHRQGLGTKILEFTIAYGEMNAINYFVAILLDTNFGSKKLLENFDFVKVGHLPNVVKFENNSCGQLIMLRKIH